MKVLLVIWTLSISPSGQLSEHNSATPVSEEQCYSFLGKVQDYIPENVIDYSISCEDYRDV